MEDISFTFIFLTKTKGLLRCICRPRTPGVIHDAINLLNDDGGNGVGAESARWSSITKVSTHLYVQPQLGCLGAQKKER